MCGLDISFVKSMLYKRIVTKFFWDYCLNSQVCNYGKRDMIELLRTVYWVPIKGCILGIWTYGPYVVNATSIESLDRL